MNSFDADRPFNLAKLMVGSEGTLGVVLNAKLNLVPLPKAKAVLAIQFNDLLESLAATPVILRHHPSAVEVMDRFILDHTRQSAALDALRRSFIDGEPGALLCVEFYGDRDEDLPPRMDAVERDLRAQGLGYRYHRVLEPAAQAQVWSLREAALGLSMAMKVGGQVALVRRRHRRRAGEAARLHRTVPGNHPATRDDGRRLRARLGRLPARAAGRQHEDRGGRAHVRGDRQRGVRSGPRVRRRALRRARRRAGAQPVHAEDVRARASTTRSARSSEPSTRMASSTRARSSTRRR